MKRFFNWQIILGLFLIILSAAVYGIHYLIFRDAHHIFIYLVGDIAFVFFEVLLVTLILHQLLHYREKKAMLNKLNMVVGTFFSEVGTELIQWLLPFDESGFSLRKILLIKNNWSDKNFIKAQRKITHHGYKINCHKGDLKQLKMFLNGKRPFLLNLLENPNILEHDSFTNLLWAIFHLNEELYYRKDLRNLPPKDYEHLALDIKRMYGALLKEWLDYMRHLKKNYSYLYSLAVRMNPFDPDASVEIE